MDAMAAEAASIDARCTAADARAAATAVEAVPAMDALADNQLDASGLARRLATIDSNDNTPHSCL